MNQVNSEIKKDFVNSKDGTIISYQVIGEGPGVVILHGAFRASQHYLRLASNLSDVFTVYIMDRRGRNESGPKGSEYSVQKECEDVIALLQKHDITYLFGHSYGGLISLNTALQHPLKKLAVYEPPTSANAFHPATWFPRFEQELKQQDYISASVTFLKGLQMGGVIGKMPKPVLKILFRAMARGPEWEENIPLLLTVPDEIRAVMNFDSSIEKYKQISAPTMIMTGTKSPEYLLTNARELESILPNTQSVSLAGLDHNAPDERAPEKIGQLLKDFFLQM